MNQPMSVCWEATTSDQRIIAHYDKRPCVLIVDDQPHHLELLEDILAEEYEVIVANDGFRALQIAKQRALDLILLDVAMPSLSGFEVCRRLKKGVATRAIPVIFLTGLGDVADETEGLSLGAVDYVTKPVNPPSLRARVRNQIRFQQAQQAIANLVEREHQAELETEKQRLEEMARSKREELKLKDEFLSHVSHELRTPLASIHGFCTLIFDGLAGKITPEQKKHLAIVLKNVQHLQSLIEDLLQITEAQSGKLQLHLERLEASSAVHFAEQTLQPVAARKGIRLSAASAAPLPLVIADPQRLRQILIILLDNALKFTPSGGEVKVSVGRSSQQEGYLVFTVEDTGCGVDPSLRERIFEHLFQVSASDRDGKSGLGLGLNIARDLVERHRGKIWVEGRPTGGSRFSFTIPEVPN